MGKWIFLVLGLLLLPSGADAAYSKRESVMTAASLEHYCTELLKSYYSIDYEPKVVREVSGFITGFYDTANMYLNPKLPDFCAPPEISIKDTCVIYNAWIIRNLQADDVFFAAPALVAALSEAYPCKKK